MTAVRPHSRALSALAAIHLGAAVVAALVVAMLLKEPADVRRPEWLEPTGRAVVATAALGVAYGLAGWLMVNGRRSGVLLAGALAAAGLLLALTGSAYASLPVNVTVLVLLTRPSVRAYAQGVNASRTLSRDL